MVVPVVIKNFLRLRLFIIAIFDVWCCFKPKGYTCYSAIFSGGLWKD